MIRRVSAAEAEAQFATLIAEVADDGAQIIIERPGRPLAALVGADVVEETRPTDAVSIIPAADQTENQGAARGALALVGAWNALTDREIDDLVAEIYERRDDDQRRPVASPG